MTFMAKFVFQLNIELGKVPIVSKETTWSCLGLAMSRASNGAKRDSVSCRGGRTGPQCVPVEDLRVEAKRLFVYSTVDILSTSFLSL